MSAWLEKTTSELQQYHAQRRALEAAQRLVQITADLDEYRRTYGRYTIYDLTTFQHLQIMTADDEYECDAVTAMAKLIEARECPLEDGNDDYAWNWERDQVTDALERIGVKQVEYEEVG